MIKDHCEYPRLEIYADKIKNNAKKIYDLCKNNGIEPVGVVKGYSAIPEVSQLFIDAGYKTIGGSRLNEIIRLKTCNLNAEYMLLRIPMHCEIPELVKYTDSSLNSEIETIKIINEEAERQNKIHGVILMVDMGDLREGYYDKNEVIEAAMEIEYNLKNINLLGIGTNLGCYGSIKPSAMNLGDLCELAENIERKIGRKLEVISGGATSTLPLLLNTALPKRINNLRIGEGIVVAKDLPDIWGVYIPNLYSDTMVLKVQIIEIKQKPSYPIGEIFVDAFGNKPEYIDKGIRKRAIVALGSKDVGDINKIKPRSKGIEVIGSSSDHLILDVEEYEGKLQVGDILEFDTYYSAMLFLCSSDSVKKVVL